jgi:hypothetical protein
MPSSPEELLRSIERTREELALTLDTIAGRLDPRAAARRGAGKVRSRVTGMFDGVRERRSRPQESAGLDGPISDGRDGGADGHDASGRALVSSKVAAAAGTAREAVRQVPTPAIAAALAAHIAFAAVIAARGRHRRSGDT